MLQLIAAGASNEGIAEQLVIAVSTVKRHVSNILGKLAVSNRTQAVTRAQTIGLLEIFFDASSVHALLLKSLTAFRRESSIRSINDVVTDSRDRVLYGNVILFSFIWV